MENLLACAVVVLVVVCCGSVSAQGTPGSLNIGCGATTSYVDPVTGIQWVPDAAYIPTGTNHEGFLPPTGSTFANLSELSTLRAFFDTRAKNCYRLPVTSNATYLVRATFFYGNYDNAANPPSFQLSLEATIVENITTSSTGVLYKEILYVPQNDATDLCLLRHGSDGGTPFVSSISLRPVTDVYDMFNVYLGQFKYMTIRTRINLGGSVLVRYPDDPFDRFWHPEGSMSPYLSPTLTPVQALGVATPIPAIGGFRPPSIVMQTAVTTSGNLTSYYLMPHSTPAVDYTTAFIILHFAELDAAATNTSREFYIDLGLGDVPKVVNIFQNASGAFQRYAWLFWDREIQSSSLLTLYKASLLTPFGPILNGLELYTVSDARLTTTRDSDVSAIEIIKASMNLSEWTRDPCLPLSYPWVECSVPILLMTAPVVTAINLTGYNLMGPISSSFANLPDLTSLSLAHNLLTGPLPDLSTLVLLETLNLESNYLSGPLPSWLTRLTNLSVLTVQNNNFSGSIPAGLLTSSNLQFTSCPGNHFTNGACEDTTTSKSKSSSLPVIIGAIAGGVVVILIIIGVGVFIGLRCCRRKASNAPQSSGSNDRPGALNEIGGNDGSRKAFNFSALAAATKNFKNEIGRGGFGPVYHGTLPDGKEVAVKVADNTTRKGDQEFYNEVAVLSHVHHRNLTTLVGYCQEKKKQILVYEYVRNGSLFDHLHGDPKPARPLDWRTRLNVAVNAAQGLDYLHSNCSPSIIHRDVKSGNILLTGPGDAAVAKVSDFGFSRAGPDQDNTHVSTEVRGTAGYLDPQYFDTRKLTLKSDVFSFGVVLLELITGRLPMDLSNPNREFYNLCQYVRNVLGGSGEVNIEEILDPAVRACRPNLEAVWAVAEVALRSVEPKAVHRPTMAVVLQELRAAVALEQASTAPESSRPPLRQHPSVQPDLSSQVFYEPDAPEPR